MTTDSNLSLTLTPEEFRAVMIRRIERCLLDAAIPQDVVADVIGAYTRTTASAIHRPTVQELRAKGEVPPPVSHTDQREKLHWPSPKAAPISEPTTIADSVLNAMFKGCRTVPQIEKGTKLPRKKIYTALWALKRDRLIDQGEPPQD